GIHRVRKIFPGTRNARNTGLTSKTPCATYFPGNARHFSSKSIQLLHHRVDGFFQKKNFAAHIHGDLFGEIPVCNGRRTSAMFLTWPVRLLAMELTESVKSFHVPATPGTCAWPPSLPSVPTSRATRVTSEAKDRNWSTIVLMVSLSSRISPLTSTAIFRERSPRATAVATSAMFRTWLVRLLAMKLTLSVRSFQVPATPGT